MRETVEFVEECRSGEAKVEGIVADISSLRGMNELCDEVLARTDRLDCLLNNAGDEIYLTTAVWGVMDENFRGKITSRREGWGGGTF